MHITSHSRFLVLISYSYQNIYSAYGSRNIVGCDILDHCDILDDYTMYCDYKDRTLRVWEHAGQAIVQMARSKNSGLEYAIKFFISCAAFVAEEGMYRKGSGAQVKSCLSQFLPQVCSFYCSQKRFHCPFASCEPCCAVRVPITIL